MTLLRDPTGLVFCAKPQISAVHLVRTADSVRAKHFASSKERTCRLAIPTSVSARAGIFILTGARRRLQAHGTVFIQAAIKANKHGHGWSPSTRAKAAFLTCRADQGMYPELAHGARNANDLFEEEVVFQGWMLWFHVGFRECMFCRPGPTMYIGSTSETVGTQPALAASTSSL